MSFAAQSSSSMYKTTLQGDDGMGRDASSYP